MAQTIAAIATPAAPAGLGVIRISGDEAIAVAQRVFRPLNPAHTPDALPGYAAAYGHVFDRDGDVDDCVALIFRAPHSYTGEDVAELSCHGGVYLLRRALRACFAAGARPAAPGEFTRRAFMNGKMDLAQAESVMDLISADGRLAARTALAAREGALAHRLEGVRRDLLAAAAQMGAYVDYPDEDIPELRPEALAATVAAAREAITGLLDTFDAGRILREGIDTAIVGAPNVGKSTLMNRLTGTERSIVTAVAGTTRDVVEETVRLGDVTLRLADTAGIRQTGDPVEKVGVDRARGRMEQAALVLLVLDGSRPLTAEERELALRASQKAAVAVINKADQPLLTDRAWIGEQFRYTVDLSAKDGTAVETLAAAVAQITGVERLNGDEPVLATERQRAAAERCREALDEAAAALEQGMTLDAVGVSLDAALSALGALTGERVTEAVVDEVFARFCVGK